MAADEGDAQGVAGLPDLAEDAFYVGLGRAVRQQEGGHEPTWRASHDGDVVGVDLHHVPADEVGGEGNRVGLGDEVAVAEVDEGGVLPCPRAEDDTRIAHLNFGEEARQQVEGKFSGLHGSVSREYLGCGTSPVRRMVPPEYGA